MSGLPRHAWVKLRLHEYRCTKCGVRKTNVERSPGQWIAQWTTPDGDAFEMRLTPPCVAGSQTADPLATPQPQEGSR